jgi:predicted nucleic acid-binding protein
MDRIYLDASIFLAHLNGNEHYSPAARSILRQGELRKVDVYTSYLSVAEVVKKRIQGLKRLSNEEDAIAALMEQPFITYVALEVAVSTYARYIIWDCGIQPRDAIHVASAIVSRCGRMYAIDGGIVSLSGRKTARLSLPEIRYPEELGDPELDL